MFTRTYKPRVNFNHLGKLRNKWTSYLYGQAQFFVYPGTGRIVKGTGPETMSKTEYTCALARIHQQSAALLQVLMTNRNPRDGEATPCPSLKTAELSQFHDHVASMQKTIGTGFNSITARRSIERLEDRLKGITAMERPEVAASAS